MPILEAIFIGTAAISSLMGIKHSKKNNQKNPKKRNYSVKKKVRTKKKAPKKRYSMKKKTPAKKKAPIKKKPSGKRWETKLQLKKQLTKRGFKFTNAQLKKESITDIRRLLKTLGCNI